MFAGTQLQSLRVFGIMAAASVNWSAGGLALAFGGDDLGPALALLLGLPGPLRASSLRQVNVLQLDQRNLDSPWVGLTINDLLQFVIDLFTLGENFISLICPSTLRSVVCDNWLVANI